MSSRLAVSPPFVNQTVAVPDAICGDRLKETGVLWLNQAPAFTAASNQTRSAKASPSLSPTVTDTQLQLELAPASSLIRLKAPPL